MNYQEHVARLCESHDTMLHDVLFCTRSERVMCPVCCNFYSETDNCWFIPHDCGRDMETEEAYVCSKECAEGWKKHHWEEIEEHEKEIEHRRKELEKKEGDHE